MRLAWFRHQIYLRNGTYMYCPTVPLPMRGYTGNTFTDFTIRWASDSQWTGQYQHLHVSNSKETSKTVCQTKQFIICQSCRKAAGSNDISTLYWYHIQSRVKIESNSHYQQCRLVLRTYNVSDNLYWCLYTWKFSVLLIYLTLIGNTLYLIDTVQHVDL